MASLNKVQLIGNLGKDAELRSMPDGTRVANVSIATSDRWKDRETGELQEHTEWHRAVFYGRLAEIVGEFTRKGAPIYVEGKLRTRKWEKDGRDVYTTEVIAEELKLLGRPASEGASEPRKAEAPASGGAAGKAKSKSKPSVGADKTVQAS